MTTWGISVVFLAVAVLFVFSEEKNQTENISIVNQTDSALMINQTETVPIQNLTETVPTINQSDPFLTPNQNETVSMGNETDSIHNTENSQNSGEDENEDDEQEARSMNMKAVCRMAKYRNKAMCVFDKGPPRMRPDLDEWNRTKTSKNTYRLKLYNMNTTKKPSPKPKMNGQKRNMAED